jgi:GNAT superfamily N-acetyltransferase
MKLLNWVRFQWDLERLSAQASPLPAHYQIAPATSEDEMGLRKVFSSSFMLDPMWNPIIGEVMQRIQTRLDGVFVSENSICLALRHGSRIIGAAILSADFAAEDHLSPGPCISMEYRNRGFGTLLLERSLHWLRDEGLTSASGIAPDYAPAAKFLYPKFEGRMEHVGSSSLVAA